MSMNINSATGTSSVSGIDSASTGSIQLMFAKLQLELAETAKTNAMDKMDQIQKAQEEQKEVAALLQEARQLKADAAAKDGKTTQPSHMREYVKANNLAYDTKDGGMCHTDEEWDVVIASLQAHQEQMGTDTQQLMVYIQDYMGQYNSYLQGANSAIQTSNQTLSSIASGR